MMQPATPHGYGYQEPSRRIKSIAIVVVVHLLIGYALVSGMAREGLKLIKKPLEAVVIQEVIIPPPPPPPPKKVEVVKEAPKPQAPPPPYVPPPDDAPAVSSTAPVIESVSAPPPAPPVIAPPPPPPPPKPVEPPKPSRADIAVACPVQVPPEMPRKALQDGTEGVVKAQARIKGGAVIEVTILSGPRVFHAAVREAMMQYKCSQEAQEVLAVQEFNFRIE